MPPQPTPAHARGRGDRTGSDGAASDATKGRRQGLRRSLIAGVASLPIVAMAAFAVGSVSAGAIGADTLRGLVGGVEAPAELPASSTASAASVDGVVVSVAPVDGVVVPRTGAAALEVEIVNGGDTAIDPGQVRLVRSDDAIDSGTELGAWLGAADAASLDTLDLATAETRAIAPGAVARIVVPAPADAFADAGVVGIGAELVVAGAATGWGVSAVTAAGDAASDPIDLALAYPLTVPPQTTGLLDAEQLATWTGQGGLLTRQLDAVAGRPVAIAIDPRIIASIRALGTAAPADAVAWLDRLAAAPNEIFPLAYADADLAVQARLELDEELEPTGFADALDPALFDGSALPGSGAGQGEAVAAGAEGVADAAADGGVAADPAATVEPTEPTEPAVEPSEEPTPEPTAPPGVPTTEELLDWAYTRTDLAWPADGSATAQTLDWLASRGLTTAILSPSNTESTDDDPARAGAASTIDGSTAVVADAGVTGALRAASAASTDGAWRDAAAALLAQLSVDADAPGATELATFARTAGAHADRVAATLDLLAANGWSTPATLSAAIGAPPVARTLVAAPDDAQRLENVRRMLAAESSTDEFSSVLADPSVLTDPTRRELLALLDVAWIPLPEEWTPAVGTWLVEQRQTVDSVSIVPSSNLLLVSRELDVPVTVENALPFPATVTVVIEPSNGRLVIEDRVEVTVEAQSRSNVAVPVAAGLGSGRVVLNMSLESPDGERIGDVVLVSANVQPDWEGLGAAILGGLLVIVFGLGILRNIRRRRRERAEADAAGDGVVADAADAADDGVAADAADVPAVADAGVAPTGGTAGASEDGSAGPDAVDAGVGASDPTRSGDSASTASRPHTALTPEDDADASSGTPGRDG